MHFKLINHMLRPVRSFVYSTARFRYYSHKINMPEGNEVDLRKKARSSPPVIGTHNGTFHCDEVLACFMLKQLPQYENAQILRSRDIKLLQESCDVIVDVGGVFDHERRFYDHHQNSFKETFSSLNPDMESKPEFNIRLSSAGLVYSFYGKEIINVILKRNKDISLSSSDLNIAFKNIYQNFICEIDGIDNGVPMFEGEPLYKISTNLSARIADFNPSWDEENTSSEMERFERAMEAAGKEFVGNVVKIGFSWINARQYVREAIESAKDIYETGEILLLKKFCPWKSHLSDLEKEYGIVGIPKLVIFSEGNAWRVAGVPVSPGSFLGRKFLPSPWRGLRDEELSKASGIPNLIFVHGTGFIGGASTMESAIAMAVKSVQYNAEN